MQSYVTSLVKAWHDNVHSRYVCGSGLVVVIQSSESFRLLSEYDDDPISVDDADDRAVRRLIHVCFLVITCSMQAINLSTIYRQLYV